MAEPKRKTSRARRDNRRSHHALNKTVNVIKCVKCEQTIKPHTTCESCGTYPKKIRKQSKGLENKTTNKPKGKK